MAYTKKRPETFKLRLSHDERVLIVRLAERLRRSQSDAVRFVLVEAARELAENHAPTEPTTTQAQATAPSDAPKTTKWTTDQIALETYKATVKMLRANYVSIILAILVIIVAILGLPLLQGTIQHFLYGATPTLTPTLVSPTATP